MKLYDLESGDYFVSDVTIYENKFPSAFSSPIVAPNFDKLEDDILYEYIGHNDDNLYW